MTALSCRTVLTRNNSAGIETGRTLAWSNTYAYYWLASIYTDTSPLGSPFQRELRNCASNCN